MKLRQFLFIAALLTAATIAGSGARPHSPSGAGRPAGEKVGEIIDLTGLRDVEFGDTAQELARRGVLHSRLESCGPSLAGHDTVSPIFVEDRLVLLWVSASVRTPQGITIGTPISHVRSAFPSLTRLRAPRGTYRFDGLLARHGDRAYLFLHDGRTVRKTIAGYVDYARKLFDEGYGPC